MKKVTRPTRSAHNSEVFEVEFTDRMPSSHPDAAGLMHGEERKIYIREGQHPLDEAETVTHEVLHQLFCGSGHFLSMEEEEKVVWYLGNVLTRHMGNNPALWRYVIDTAQGVIHG